MNFKCEINNINYKDKNLIKALDNISETVEYELRFELNEIDHMIHTYFKKNLGIDLEESEMSMDLFKEEIYYNNTSEADAIFNTIQMHFGSNSIFYKSDNIFSIKSLVLIRKMARFAIIDRDCSSYVFTFDQANEFTNTWIYKYIQNKGEDK